MAALPLIGQLVGDLAQAVQGEVFVTSNVRFGQLSFLTTIGNPVPASTFSAFLTRCKRSRLVREEK